MPEPSLGELTNLRVDSDLGGGRAPNVINNAETVRNLNDSARFKAQNDIDRYTKFLGQLQDVYKTNLDTASIDVMPQDREALQDRTAEIMQKIGDDPKSFFSGRGQAEVYKDLTDVRRDATKSKNDYVYDQAHREFVERNPQYNTAETKDKFNNFGNTSLQQRKPFLLEMPVQLDLSALSSQISGINGVTVANPSGLKYIDGQPFIHSSSSIKFKPYIQAWDAALAVHPDYEKWAEQQLKTSPKYIQDNYKKNDGSYDVQSFWHHLGLGTFQGEVDETDATGNTKKDLLVKDELKPDTEYAGLLNAKEKVRHDKATEYLGSERNKLALDKFYFQQSQLTKSEQVGKEKYTDLVDGVNGNLKDFGSIDVDKLPPSRQFIGGVVYNEKGAAQNGRVYPKTTFYDKDNNVVAGDKYKFSDYSNALATKKTKLSYPEWVQNKAKDDGLRVESRYDVSYKNSDGSKLSNPNDLTPDQLATYQKLSSKYRLSFNDYLKGLAKIGKIYAQFEGSNGVGTPSSIIEGERFEQSKAGKKGFAGVYDDDEDGGESSSETSSSGSDGSETQ